MSRLTNKVLYKKYENLSRKTDFICLTNLEEQWQSMRANLNLCRAYVYYPGCLESCDSLAKDNFVRATLRKVAVVCGSVWKNVIASRNFYVIYA